MYHTDRASDAYIAEEMSHDVAEIIAQESRERRILAQPEVKAALELLELARSTWQQAEDTRRTGSLTPGGVSVEEGEALRAVVDAADKATTLAERRYQNAYVAAKARLFPEPRTYVRAKCLTCDWYGTVALDADGEPRSDCPSCDAVALGPDQDL